LDARDCALFRESFGLNADGAGSGSDGYSRAPPVAARHRAGGHRQPPRPKPGCDGLAAPVISSLRRPPPQWLIPMPRCISPLRLFSGRRRASPTSHWSWVSSRAAYRRARSPARIATVVLVGCSGAGPGWRCRAWIADRTVYLGGPATFGAGPLMCADGWAVTVWRIASAARLRQSRGHRTERGHSVLQLGTTEVTPSAKLASSPGRADRARPSAAAGRPRAGQGPEPRARSHGLACYSPRPRPALLRQAEPASEPPRASPSQRAGAGQYAARITGRQSRSVHGQCTTRSCPTPVRAESARQAPAELRA
jgi:hypothetical protein